jgi:hypothetical protein
MRNIILASSLFAVSALALFACSGSDNTATPAADAGTDAPKVKSDASADAGGDSAAPNVNISGTTEIAVMVVSGSFGYPKSGADKGTGVDGADARIENADGSGWLEGVTDATGKVTFKVDLAKGPFDITAAKADLGAASILGVKAAADVAGKSLWLPQQLATKEYTISGAISNAGATNSVQLDCAWFATAWLKNGGSAVKNYSTKHVWVQDDQAPVNVAALEIDPMNNLIDGVWTPTQARTQGTMIADVDFSKNKIVMPSTANITLNLPATGQLTGAMVDAVGDLTGATGLGPWTNSTVAKSVGQSAAYVGIGVLSLPANGASKFRVQYLGGDLQPDYATAFMYKKNSGNGLSIHVKKADLVDGKQITIPTMSPMSVTDSAGAGPGGSDAGAGPSDLSDAFISFDGSAADFVGVSISESNAASNNRTVWELHFIGKTASKKSIPHLPSKIALSDITGASNLILGLAAGKGLTLPTDFAAGQGGGQPADFAFDYSVQLGANR